MLMRYLTSASVLLSLAVSLAQAQAPAQNPPPAQQQSPAKPQAPVQRLGPNLLRIGNVQIDTAKREVSVAGVVNEVHQGGYALEVAIPWSMYGLTPTGGLRLGFALNSSDDDQPGVAVQESMISTVSTRTLTDPTTWGTLQLDP